MDTKVQSLLELVAKKKESIKKLEKPSYITNLTFSFTEGTQDRINLNVNLDVSQYVKILSFLRRKYDDFISEIKLLKIDEKEQVKIKFLWQGYSFSDWESDLIIKINMSFISQEKAKLKKLEETLDSLISPELKRQLALDEIERQLLDD